MNNLLIILIVLLIALFVITYITFPSAKIHYNDIGYFVQCGLKIGYLLNNNILDRPLTKKNRIAIVTYDDRKDTKYIELHNKNITDYCKHWNYDYIYYDKCVHNVYWCKIYMVLDLLKSGKYDYVMWMDSDTIIKNPLISLDSIVNKYSSDIYVNVDGGLSAFCAGVFIIKNSEIGKKFLEDCIKYNNEKCLTEDNKLKGFWTGLCYEQGAINKLIFDKYEKYTTCLPKYYVYNSSITENMATCDTDTFILHVYGSPNDLRAKCFERFTSNEKH